MMNSPAHVDLKSAVQSVVEEVRFAVRLFEVSEEELLRRARGQESETIDIRRVLDALKTNCTGNLK